MIPTIGIILVVIGAVGFFFAGQTTLAVLLALVALVLAFVVGKPILGNPAGISKLPEGVTPQDIKNYRSEHPGTSVSEAIRVCARQQRG